MTVQTATTQTLATYLTTGYWAAKGSKAHSFDTSASTVITVNLTGLTIEGQALARAALDAWEAVANLQFQETTGAAQITFDDNQTGASASSSYNSLGDITSASVNVDAAWIASYGTTVGSYGYQTYLHEIGHALGLGHAGNYNGNANFATNALFSNDSWQSSVMSYFNQDQNTLVNASVAYVLTPMMADIVAIQALYGAPVASNPGTISAGDTLWGMGMSTGTYLDKVFQGASAGLSRKAMTIADIGGVDTIDFSNDYRAQIVDLNAGAFSSAYGSVGNLGIALGTTIENFVAGTGSDKVTGNGVANAITLNAGNDFAYGGLGDDRLFGGAGADSLYGGDGADQLEGGTENDLLTAGTGNDRLAGQDGDDRLFGEAGNDVLTGDAGIDVIDGGTGNDGLDGGAGNDSLLGQDGVDVLSGGEGNDSLSGGLANDTLDGGDGIDRLDGGDGIDRLDGGIGADTLSGVAGNDVLLGGDGDDRLNGGVGNDTLSGGAGADILDGSSGNDAMTGGEGADLFVFQSSKDLVLDFEDNVDTLSIDNALWANGTLTVDKLLSTYGSISDGDALLTFGSSCLRIEGVGSLDALKDDIMFC